MTEDVDRFIASDHIKDQPMEVTRNAQVWYSDSAKIQARLEAPLMERYRMDQDRLVLPEGLILHFFDPFPNESALVKARYGIRYPSEKITELMHNVVIVNEKGDTLETEHLIWEEANERIYSEKLVKVTTPDEVIIAEGFESDPTFSEYTFYHIKGTIRAEP